jgi:predicted alpha-1,6-mannanase (GH76 family)
MNFRNANGGIIWLVYLASLSITGFASAQTTEQGRVDGIDSGSYAEHATLAVESMQKWYDLETGLYKTTGWWNAANLITTLADYSKSQRSHSYDFVFSNTLSTAQKKFPGFVNEYYDDEGWWALAWIDVYEHTHDPRYLEAAQFIFQDMTYGWDDACSGGIWWSKDRKYKNAIANELFLSVAAKLAIETKDIEQQKEYLTWAHKEWMWFSHSGMINQKNLVNDGLNGKCENNGQATWSYNQGVILGGLAALSRVDHSSPPLAMANKIAQAAISNLSDTQGILHDSCEPHCGADGTQFKGIFIRNLRELGEVGAQGFPSRQFILTNARSIWSQVQPPDYHLGEVWGPPFGATDASTQGSALDTLVAATTLSHENKAR